MTKAKSRLSQLSAKMRTGKPISEIGKTEIGEADTTAPHGSRGDFRKVTVTLPPVVYAALVQESSRRKIAGEPDPLLASIVREAVVSHLKKL